MKVTFYSNYLNHHQLPFCLEMASKCDFTFIATAPIDIKRINLGYQDINKRYPFVLCTYDSQTNYQKALLLAEESDVVIHGSAPEEFIKRRLDANKLTFRYSERIYKQGIWRVISPRGLVNMFKKHTLYRKKNVFLLCASAYTAYDFSLVGAYKNKTYKWGYFPEVKKYDSIDKLMGNKEPTVILWVARLIPWKHPETTILIAKKLKEAGYHFQLKIIGNGEMACLLKQMIQNYHLEDCVYLLGAMSTESVRLHMEKAGTFMFTSDYNEGWGAVLNEAMNSGCAVVASHAIGSVPFLLKHEHNGLIYQNGDIDDLYNKVKYLLENPKKQVEFGENAYKTLTDTWNAHVAAERFIQLVQEIQIHEQCNLFDNGPCSRAEIMNNKWFCKK